MVNNKLSLRLQGKLTVNLVIATPVVDRDGSTIRHTAEKRNLNKNKLVGGEHGWKYHTQNCHRMTAFV
jgi:hypothetical protein